VEFDYRYLDEMEEEDEVEESDDSKSLLSQDTTVIVDPHFEPSHLSRHPLQVMVSKYII
jgi:hypothetical protein